MSVSLLGHRVLVTRPRHQQAEWVAGLEAVGAQAICLPLLDILTPSNGDRAATLRRALLDLDRFDLLIFISINAVRMGLAAIEDYWPQFPLGIELVAIGPTTSRELQQQVGGTVLCAPGGMTSEDLLTLPCFDEISDKRVGIVCGEGGREVIARQLRERGARVESLEVYRRVEIHYDDTALREALRESEPTVLTAASGESLQALRSVIDQSSQLGDTDADRQLKTPLIVPSARVKALALALGFSRVVDAAGADTESLLRALATLPPPRT